MLSEQKIDVSKLAFKQKIAAQSLFCSSSIKFSEWAPVEKWKCARKPIETHLSLLPVA